MTLKRTTAMTMMKRWLLALSMAVFSAAMFPADAEARRLGGGSSSGLKRDLPARTAPDAVPAKPSTPNATPNAAPNAAAAAPAKRSWMAPLAGLAAGLGLAALASHLGFGEELANMMMLALLAVLAVVAVRFVMRRMAPAAPAGPKLAGAGAPFNLPAGRVEPFQPAPMASAAPVSSTPTGFDAEAFERIAKMIFIRMQAANDSGDLTDLRNFTTPEMYASIKLDLNERGAAAQQTDVVQIDAKVIDVAEETQRQIVSVRFNGLVREQRDNAAEPFDEVWHLVRPTDGSREWAIAGIQQTA